LETGQNSYDLVGPKLASKRLMISALRLHL
jgi:hypothetical protein